VWATTAIGYGGSITNESLTLSVCLLTTLRLCLGVGFWRGGEGKERLVEW